MMFKCKISLMVLIFVLLMGLSACSNDRTIRDGDISIEFKDDDQPNKKMPEDKAVNVGALNGPTGLGLAFLMNKTDAGNSLQEYNFSIVTTPDEMVAKLINGEIDVAAIPTNLAANLYNKSGGSIRVASLITGANLYVLENGTTINSIKDLSGKTIYASGLGATPQYALEAILADNGINDCTIEYKTEHAELAALMAAGEVDIAMSPEPFVSSIMINNSDVRIALSLGDEWKKVNDDQGLYTGCVVVRNEFLSEYPTQFEVFMDECLDSVNKANENTSEIAELAANYGIISNAEIANRAIPNCNLNFVVGNDMKGILDNLYQTLYTANPDSIGGSIPDEEFYYIKQD